MMQRALCLMMGAMSLAAQAGGPLLVSPIGSTDAPAAPWHLIGLPQQVKPLTRFNVVPLDGQRVLKVETQASYGNLVHPVLEQANGHLLRWRWRLDEPLSGSDLQRREGDDSPLKVCALFDLPMAAVPFIERQVLRVARLRSGEQLPAASVCYVWDAHLPVGTVLDNAFTRRLRMIVLRGPEAGLRTWYAEQRDVFADFKRLFADEATTVPPLVGIGIGADADNTQGHSVGYVAGMSLD